MFPSNQRLEALLRVHSIMPTLNSQSQTRLYTWQRQQDSRLKRIQQECAVLQS